MGYGIGFERKISRGVRDLKKISMGVSDLKKISMGVSDVKKISMGVSDVKKIISKGLKYFDKNMSVSLALSFHVCKSSRNS